MTRAEIQAVIDKGGYLILTESINICLFKPEAIGNNSLIWGANEYYSVYPEKGRHYDNWGFFNWREATPEEIKKYVK